jgi:hypothetical protein
LVSTRYFLKEKEGVGKHNLRIKIKCKTNFKSVHLIGGDYHNNRKFSAIPKQYIKSPIAAARAYRLLKNIIEYKTQLWLPEKTEKWHQKCIHRVILSPVDVK